MQANTKSAAGYIAKCAQWEQQVLILECSRCEDDYGDFETLTTREINGIADRAAMVLIRQGIIQLREQKALAITLLGQASTQYVAAFLALAKLEYLVFLMPPRLLVSTIAALLVKTDCRYLVYTPNMKVKIEEAQAIRDVKTLPTVTQTELNFNRVFFQASNYGVDFRINENYLICKTTGCERFLESVLLLLCKMCFIQQHRR